MPITAIIPIPGDLFVGAGIGVLVTSATVAVCCGVVAVDAFIVFVDVSVNVVVGPCVTFMVGVCATFGVDITVVFRALDGDPITTNAAEGLAT
jgi:hypothetical protein